MLASCGYFLQEKQLCWNLFSILSIAKFLRARFFEEHFLTATSENVFIKIIHNEKKTVFLTSETSENVCFYL